MHRFLLSLLLTMLGCSARPTTYPVTEEDSYAVYRAILLLNRERHLGVSLEVNSVQYTSSVWDSPELASIDGFNPAALSAFHARSPVGAPVDITRLKVRSDGGTSALRFAFAQVAFDPTGRHAVTVVSVAGGGESLVALTRTWDGGWAVVAQRLLAIY